MTKILIVQVAMMGFLANNLMATEANLKCVCACKDNITKLNLSANMPESRSLASLKMHFAEDTPAELCHAKKEACKGFDFKSGTSESHKGTLHCVLEKQR